MCALVAMYLLQKVLYVSISVVRLFPLQTLVILCLQCVYISELHCVAFHELSGNCIAYLLFRWISGTCVGMLFSVEL